MVEFAHFGSYHLACYPNPNPNLYPNLNKNSNLNPNPNRYPNPNPYPNFNLSSNLNPNTYPNLTPYSNPNLKLGRIFHKMCKLRVFYLSSDMHIVLLFFHCHTITKTKNDHDDKPVRVFHPEFTISLIS